MILIISLLFLFCFQSLSAQGLIRFIHSYNGWIIPDKCRKPPGSTGPSDEYCDLFTCTGECCVPKEYRPASETCCAMKQDLLCEKHAVNNLCENMCACFVNGTRCVQHDNKEPHKVVYRDEVGKTNPLPFTSLPHIIPTFPTTRTPTTEESTQTTIFTFDGGVKVATSEPQLMESNEKDLSTVSIIAIVFATFALISVICALAICYIARHTSSLIMESRKGSLDGSTTQTMEFFSAREEQTVMLKYPTGSSDSTQKQGSTGSAVTFDEQQRRPSTDSAQSLDDPRRPSTGSALSFDDPRRPSTASSLSFDESRRPSDGRSADDYSAPPITVKDMFSSGDPSCGATNGDISNSGYSAPPITGDALLANAQQSNAIHKGYDVVPFESRGSLPHVIREKPEHSESYSNGNDRGASSSESEISTTQQNSSSPNVPESETDSSQSETDSTQPESGEPESQS